MIKYEFIRQAVCSVRWYICPKCDGKFTTGIAKAAHERRCVSAQLTAPTNRPRLDIPVVKSALNGRFKMISLPVPKEVGADYQGVFTDMEDQLVAILEEILGCGLKVYLSLQLDMVQYINGDKLRHGFHSPTLELLQTTDIRATLQSLSPSVVENVRILLICFHYKMLFETI